jgi:hypothetical protein
VFEAPEMVAAATFPSRLCRDVEEGCPVGWDI